MAREVLGRRGAHHRGGAIGLVGRGPALECEGAAPGVAADRGGGSRTRRSATPGTAPCARAARRGTRAAAPLACGEPESERPHGQQALRAEAGVGPLQPEEAAGQEPGADQQDDRHRDLGDDERVVQPVAARCRPRCARPDLSDAATSPREARSAGSSPERSAVASETASVNAATPRVDARSRRAAADPGAPTCQQHDAAPGEREDRAARRARRSPAAASSSHCRTRRPRLAPSAARTAASFARASPARAAGSPRSRRRSAARGRPRPPARAAPGERR